jgi:hypothetical protein
MLNAVCQSLLHCKLDLIDTAAIHPSIKVFKSGRALLIAYRAIYPSKVFSQSKLLGTLSHPIGIQSAVNFAMFGQNSNEVLEHERD